MEIGFSRKSLTLIVGLLLILSTTFVLGQGIVTGSISGTVLDQQQAVVSGAKVTATNTATNQQFIAESNSQGYFAVRGLPVGNYSVTIEAPKFTRVKVSDVVVSSNRDTALGGRTLSIGTTELVTVEGSAPLVESNSIQIANSFSSKKVTDLPVNNGVDQLAYLVPGVVPTGDVAFGNSNGASFAANGQRGRSSNFQIDGQNNNDNSVTGPQLGVTNPDTIAEFQVITNYTAEYGRNTGSIINIVTKSGSNAIHGSVHEFYTSDNFHSLGNEEKSPFLGFCPPGVNGAGPDGVVDTLDDTCAAVKKNQFIENRYGFTLGGPVIKDKIWGYGSYQGDRIAQSGIFNSANTGFVPTPTGLATLQSAFPGNPGVAAIASIGATAYPGATYSGQQPIDVSNGTTTVPVEFGVVTRRLAQPFHENEWSLRGDWQATSKDRVFARYIRQSNIFSNSVQFAAGRFAVGQFADVPAKSQQIAIDWSRSWTTSLLNQFRFSYGKLEVTFEKGSNPGCAVAQPDNCPIDISFLDSTFSNFGLAVNAPQGRGVNNYQYQDNLQWQVGKMTLKMGGEFVHQRSPAPFLPRFNGQFIFLDFDSLIQNDPARFTMALGNFTNNYKENDVAAYFQNDWRVKDNLTLNMGLRWEWQEQAINLLHDLSLANQTGSIPFWNTTLPIEATTVPKYDQDLNNFGPVFGFAWTPRIWKGFFGEDKTVIRGGYAIKYDPAFYNLFLNVSTSAPTVNLGLFNSPVLGGTDVVPQLPSVSNYIGTEIRPALSPTIPSNCGTSLCDPRFRAQTQVDTNFRNPYTEQWSFGIQRQIGTRMAAEVRYVGNHGVGLFQTINGNPALNKLITNGFDGSIPGRQDVIPDGLTPCTLAGQPGAGTATVRGHVDCSFRNVLKRINTGFSMYHGLQTRFETNNWHGVSANLAYTFSKVIDNASEVFSTIAGGQGIVGSQNPFDVNRGERGVAGQDFPHVFSMAIAYELPWLKSQQGFAGHVFGGWQINTIYRYTSGQPWTPVEVRQATGSSFCDQTGTISATFDVCRPIETNTSAAFDSVGQLTSATSGVAVDKSNGNCFQANGRPITTATATCQFQSPNAFHWLINDNNAALFFGNPFLGVGRNTFRGQTTNNVNLGIFKNTKITERVTLQFQANAYNLFNRQFRGVPDVVIDDVDNTISSLTGRPSTTFGNNFANPSGNFNTNANESGIGIRRLIFGMKVIF